MLYLRSFRTHTQCRTKPQLLSADQYLLTTLMVKLAVVAILATMLVRFPWFRRILLTEKRDWPERLIFAASLGLPLTAGVVARLLLDYNAADLTLAGSFLAGLLAGPYAGAIVGVDGRAAAARSPANGSPSPSPSAAASPGGGLREICPKEAIWHFSPLFFTDLHRKVWRLVSRFQIEWVVILLAAPIGARDPAAVPRVALRPSGATSSHLLPRRRRRRGCTRWSSSPPCSAWPSRSRSGTAPASSIASQEQEKLLMAARVEALASQINPHFLFNTLTSISSLIRSQPETARMLIVKLSGLLRRLLRSQEHFVTLREELEAIDEYLDIEAVRFGSKLRIEKAIAADTLDIVMPSMLLQPLVENSIKHGLAPKIGEGRITIRSVRQNGHAIIDVIDDGVGRQSRATPIASRPAPASASATSTSG